jgi:hypothetical protein
MNLSMKYRKYDEAEGNDLEIPIHDGYLTYDLRVARLTALWNLSISPLVNSCKT